ncbi:MAG: glutamyl-tRNA reductase [Proteobacteria bacterium]|nr:glutamyl-tRNA reductase [Pseudomonadota bacterium]
MNLLIIGINHTSAPVELREKVAFTPEQLEDALKDISMQAGLQEVAILSTCNRTEVIASGDNIAPLRVINWLADYHQIDPADLEHSIYILNDNEAALHAMRVACGLDSMVVGEPQILGQFKECFDQARQFGTLGGELDHLSQTSFRVAKKVRTETAIGENSVSVAATSVTLAQQLFTDLSDCNILLIGAGETSELVGRHLVSAGIKHITVANRTIENARRLAKELDGSAIDLQSIPTKLPETDIVIAATAAQLPILGKGTVERALKSRKHRPILMVDLAVPRDIEPEVSELRDIYLYSVDDLQQIVDTNLNSRQAAARNAEAILAKEISHYRSRHQTKGAEEKLIRFRDHHNNIKTQELERAVARLEKGADPTEVLTQLANQLTNKIIHIPSVQLKAAIDDDAEELVAIISTLYKLDDDVE